MATSSAPVLSTPAEHIFEAPTILAPPSSEPRLSDEQLYLQYEIRRTVAEIHAGKWKRIALQFPDELLVDAPRVFDRLRQDLRKASLSGSTSSTSGGIDEIRSSPAAAESTRRDDGARVKDLEGVEEALCILADTSYGACCVDEVAAEHVNAEVVVHYGRSCLSPTARLPVIYVFTTKTLNMDATVSSFLETYKDKAARVCLMADIPYHHHIPQLRDRLVDEGYSNIFETHVVHNPSSLLPNRTLPEEVKVDSERLREYAVFHISSPPTALLLILSSRVKSIHIYPTSHDASTSGHGAALEASTAQVLRRRYALLTQLSTVSVFGILINTLSVSNYMQALHHCQSLIAQAGKKSYVFVVGKVNAAKVANFGEIGGWVVIGCWESSLIESADFYRPIITPFELEVALTDDKERVWGGEWVGDFSSLLGKEKTLQAQHRDESDADVQTSNEGNWDEQQSDDEPPEFDLRTGRYVSHSRPMGRPKPVQARNDSPAAAELLAPPVTSALVQRSKDDIISINGSISPAAEFLRSKRTWQGLGSDYQIAYERNEDGNIRGAAMEEGRAGVAKGYTIGEQEAKS